MFPAGPSKCHQQTEEAFKAKMEMGVSDFAILQTKLRNNEKNTCFNYCKAVAMGSTFDGAESARWPRGENLELEFRICLV